MVMTGLTGEAGGTLRLNFGRPVLLQFRGPAITADTGLPISVLLHHARTPSRLLFMMGALAPERDACQLSRKPAPIYRSQ